MLNIACALIISSFSSPTNWSTSLLHWTGSHSKIRHCPSTSLSSELSYYWVRVCISFNITSFPLSSYAAYCCHPCRRVFKFICLYLYLFFQKSKVSLYALNIIAATVVLKWFKLFFWSHCKQCMSSRITFVSVRTRKWCLQRLKTN